MKKIMLTTTAAIALAVSAAAEAFENSVTITAAAGEFQNSHATHQQRVEARAGVLGNGYAVARGELNSHPRHEIENQLLVGGGYHWAGWHAELVANDDRYLGSLIYHAPTENWELRGGVIHGNKWGKGFKQTGLVTSVGYPITSAVSVGAFYEIRNTTAASVDDLYGGYLTWRYR